MVGPTQSLLAHVSHDVYRVYYIRMNTWRAMPFRGLGVFSVWGLGHLAWFWASGCGRWGLEVLENSRPPNLNSCNRELNSHIPASWGSPKPPKLKVSLFSVFPVLEGFDFELTLVYTLNPEP